MSRLKGEPGEGGRAYGVGGVVHKAVHVAPDLDLGEVAQQVAVGAQHGGGEHQEQALVEVRAVQPAVAAHS